MFKKIATVAALAASASFATYTIFPVGENHTGEVVVTGAYDSYSDPDGFSDMSVKVGGEFVVIPGLELSIYNLGYQFWFEHEDCDDDCDDSDGIKAMTIGARYQVIPVVSVALDLGLPLTSKDVAAVDPFRIFVAAQFSTEIIQNLYFGSEVGLHWFFEDEDITAGKVVAAQAEFDYAIPSLGLTPWIGGAFDVRVTDSDPKIAGESGDNQFTFWAGLQYDISKMFYVKGNFLLGRGDLDGDYIGGDASFGVRF